jgi:23S rRNA (cytosine1962-C5)-methyltransferase
MLFFNKPHGVSTKEVLEYICYREDDVSVISYNYLETEVTGVLAFEPQIPGAAKLELPNSVAATSSRFLFLSDHTALKEVSKYNNSNLDSKAEISFSLLESSHGLGLWEARTSLPHSQSHTHSPPQSQPIRSAANQCGIPILGDTAHGGSPFPVVCLHQSEIQIAINDVHNNVSNLIQHSEPPKWFVDRELTQDRQLITWLSAIDRRLRINKTLDANQTQRLIHTEGGTLRIDQLGSVYVLSWYGTSSPNPTELARIERLAQISGWEQWYLQIRENRGGLQNKSQHEGEHCIFGKAPVPLRWVAQEQGLNYEFRRDQGLSPGLFLDQRRNRSWIKHNAAKKRILNLFCYTGGFSVCASQGGASKVVSVDVSKPFLEWTKTNFLLNNIDLLNHEFRAMDSREYLSWAKKKNLEFDTIICDPPSFGRSSYGVFSIEKDFTTLLASLLAVTAKNGLILFSSNYEKWTMSDFSNRVNDLKKSERLNFQIEATPDPDWDFELPQSARLMKSFFIRKNY